MTDDQMDAPDDKKAIKDEAIEWVVRMRGPDSGSLRGRFEQWLAQSPEHRRAHEWATRHFTDAGVLKASTLYGTNARQRVSPSHWLIAGAAVAVAATLLLVVLIGNPVSPSEVQTTPAVSALSSPLTTRRGEIRTFRLADGSSVTLDSESKLAFAMDASTRHLALERGKARFTIARDSRPFVVTAGAGKITAEAATFDVGYDEDRDILVRLISGRADVQPQAQPATYVVPVRQVPTGGGLSYRAADFTEIAVSRRPRDVDDSDWPSGWVEYRSVPLDVLVRQANRYADRPVIVDGPAVGSLEASGRFRLTDTNVFVERIAEVFDLDVSRHPDGIHLSPK